ncbi:hypothetical protein B566_EDAN001116 [Ephemera danica]|nr:hypothetical protein B566_EDAN001116 [Ephemera danica]
MRICWEENPALRPTFKEISLKLEGMLQEGADYLDLNSLIINNRGYMSEPCTVPLLQDSSTSSSYDDTDQAGPASLSSRHSEKYESPIISGPKLTGIPLQYLEVEDVSYKKSA